MSRKRVHLRIQGIVQGVGYRASCAHEAHSRALDGWVRNREDGSVELEAEGSEAELRELVTWCRRGPRGSRVTQVDETWSEPAGDSRGFRIR
jgi:acylphosphatase